MSEYFSGSLGVKKKLILTCRVLGGTRKELSGTLNSVDLGVAFKI